jgi:hypothetical protein
MLPTQLLEVQFDVALEMHSLSDKGYICGWYRHVWVLLSPLDRLSTTSPALAVLNWAHNVSQ